MLRSFQQFSEIAYKPVKKYPTYVVSTKYYISNFAFAENMLCTIYEFNVYGLRRSHSINNLIQFRLSNRRSTVLLYWQTRAYTQCSRFLHLVNLFEFRSEILQDRISIRFKEVCQVSEKKIQSLSRNRAFEILRDRKINFSVSSLYLDFSMEFFRFFNGFGNLR